MEKYIFWINASDCVYLELKQIEDHHRVYSFAILTDDELYSLNYQKEEQDIEDTALHPFPVSPYKIQKCINHV